MRASTMGLFALCVVFSTSVRAAADDATAAALAWLSLIDKADYQASWADAGTLFRTKVTASGWATAAGSVRPPLGAVITRNLASVQALKSLPGAPDGDYEILRFSTQFASKREAAETVILAREAEGWRVDGYFIK